MAESALVVAYFAVSFLLAALTVRMTPRSRLGRVIRRRYWLFPALPLLWTLALVSSIGALSRPIRKCGKRMFEGASGHRTYVPLNAYNLYSGLPRRDFEPVD